MSWQEGVAVAVVLLGLGAGTVLVALRPSFWIELGARFIKAQLHSVVKYHAKRMPPGGGGLVSSGDTERGMIGREIVGAGRKFVRNEKQGPSRQIVVII